MSSPPGSVRIPCREFRELVYHFVADELGSAERERLEEHLHDCPPCSRYLELERGFETALRRRLACAQAPAAVRDRVVGALRREAAAGPRRSAARRVVGGLLAAAATVVVAFGAYSLFRGAAAAPAGDEGGRVVRVVTVVDVECDRAGHSAEQQRKCTTASHLNALRLRDGTYWNLALDDRLARELVADPAIRGRRIYVEGELYRPLRTLHLIRWSDLTPERLRGRAAPRPATSATRSWYALPFAGGG